MAYFDNAATTYPKPEIVYQSMDQFQRHTGGSFGPVSYTHLDVYKRQVLAPSARVKQNI